MEGLFVTATDTGVGKSVLSACLLASMAAAGLHVRAFKPVVTGLEEPPESDWPPDHELLASVSGQHPEDVARLRFGPAVSPHLAAELDGRAIDPAALLEHARAGGETTTLIAEGVGGLLVPLTPSYSICDLARELGLPLVIAARPGLGTINHTLLTLRVAREVGLDVRAVVLTPWTEPDALELSNRETIAALGEVEVACLPHVAQPLASDLAVAGATLAWPRWLSG
jgi:dethiobiotin synthetase